MSKLNIWKFSTFVLLILVLGLGAYMFFFKKAPFSQNGMIVLDDFTADKKDLNKFQNPAFAPDNNDFFYNKPTQIQFDQELYDFDTIEEGTVLKKEIEYLNTGKNPYFVLDVKVSCGCTVPSYEKAPVAPSKKGKVKVEYNSAGKDGFSMNKLTLYGNVNGDQKSTFFKVFVKKKK
jgi:hypothetical protein